MGLAEFTENYLPIDPATPYRELFVWDDESPNEKVGFFCNHCGWDCNNDNGPCPKHAPKEFPGLRLVECDATPRHWLFAHDRDDYGHGCPWCWANKEGDKVRYYERCQHWAWRRWALTRWIVFHLPLTGYGHQWGNGCNSCMTFTALRWKWSR